MGLSSSPKTLVSTSLLSPESVPGKKRTVTVVMLKDGRGMTTHGRRPRVVSPLKGDQLQVSSDLAYNWESAGFCRIEIAGTAMPSDLPAKTPAITKAPSTTKSESGKVRNAPMKDRKRRGR